MSAKREQLLAWIGAGPRAADADLGVRLRSTVFVLLGLTTASCLAIVALLVHQGVPLLPSLPLPGIGGGDERVATAEPVEGARSPVVTASDRPADATPSGVGADAGHGGPRATNAPAHAVSPGPASAVAQPKPEDPVAAPVPVSSPPAGTATPAPASDSAPVGQPSTAAAGSPTDSQLNTGGRKGRSSKGSGKSSSATSRGQDGTDAAAAPASQAPEAPPIADAEPEPVTDVDDGGHGHGHRHRH